MTAYAYMEFTMRLFIAIEIPKQMKSEILRLQTALRQSASSGRFVPVDNMHITLSFLGETNDAYSAISAMKKATEGIYSFPLHLGGYNFFEREGSKTSYVEVFGDMKELRNLHSALSAALRDYGFKTDYKQFTPHITLGRNVIHDDKCTTELQNLNPTLNASMNVSAIILFESIRKANGMEYIPLHKEQI
jgi:2'-5' RNA ligase